MDEVLCSFCNSDIESLDHLLLHCTPVRECWAVILRWCGVSWATLCVFQACFFGRVSVFCSQGLKCSGLQSLWRWCGLFGMLETRRFSKISQLIVMKSLRPSSLAYLSGYQQVDIQWPSACVIKSGFPGCQMLHMSISASLFWLNLLN